VSKYQTNIITSISQGYQNTPHKQIKNDAKPGSFGMDNNTGVTTEQATAATTYQYQS
jgi:hypothetical protein